MGIYDLFSDLASAFGVSSVDADAPAKDEDKSEGQEVSENKEDGGEEKGEEPEEEEEEEPEDIKPKLEEGELLSIEAPPHAESAPLRRFLCELGASLEALDANAMFRVRTLGAVCFAQASLR